MPGNKSSTTHSSSKDLTVNTVQLNYCLSAIAASTNRCKFCITGMVVLLLHDVCACYLVGLSANWVWTLSCLHMLLPVC